MTEPTDSIPTYSDDVKAQVDEKDIQIHQTVLLSHILAALEPEQPDAEPQYECGVCHATVPHSKRKEHARDCYDWREDLGMPLRDGQV